jgi:hypothetical protein
LVSEYKQKELNGELLPEPLLVENKKRFVMFPILHRDVSTVPCMNGFFFSYADYCVSDLGHVQES